MRRGSLAQTHFPDLELRHLPESSRPKVLASEPGAWVSARLHCANKMNRIVWTIWVTETRLA